MALPLARLPLFLGRLAGLVSYGGQTLADSLDVGSTTDETHLACQDQILGEGRYRGDIRICFEYGRRAGPFCPWLLVDFSTLADIANQRGWCCNLSIETEHGEFLAPLAR
jgi:hypothetical protein